QHLVDRFVEIGRRFALEAKRIDACDDKCLEIWTLEPARLHSLHRFVHQLIELEQLLGALSSRGERRRQLAAKELVAALENRMIGAAREAAILLIAEAKRDECRFLELDLILALRTIVERGERFGETSHLERALAEVVRLLGVEQQNAVRDFRLGHD